MCFIGWILFLCHLEHARICGLFLFDRNCIFTRGNKKQITILCEQQPKSLQWTALCKNFNASSREWMKNARVWPFSSLPTYLMQNVKDVKELLLRTWSSRRGSRRRSCSPTSRSFPPICFSCARGWAHQRLVSSKHPLYLLHSFMHFPAFEKICQLFFS